MKTTMKIYCLFLSFFKKYLNQISQCMSIVEIRNKIKFYWGCN